MPANPAKTLHRNHHRNINYFVSGGSTMKRFVLTAAIVFAVSTTAAHAQFGSGIVYDPTQSAHAIQQLTQGSQLYTTTIQTTQNVISAYNLAQRMAASPDSLYHPFVSPSTYWVNVPASANTYSNTTTWTNAVNTGSGASAGYQQVTVPRTAQLNGYGNLSTSAQQQIAAQGATADLNDSVTASSMQTLGTIRSNSEQRQTDITTLENATQSADPAQHTEMATLQRINQALILMLKQQQEANQIGQAYTLQQIVAQKQQQDALKAGFQDAADFSSTYQTRVAPAYSGTAQALNY
jgi:hypothetical protein